MADAQAYIRERLSPRLEWYDRRAVFNKRLHLILQFLSMAGSVLLVLLIHIKEIERGALAVVAALVTLCLAAERVGRFGELWWSYRLAAEALSTEQHLFRHRVGPYAIEDGAAAALMVERCEALLTQEAMDWKRTVRGHGSTVGPRESIVE